MWKYYENIVAFSFLHFTFIFHFFFSFFFSCFSPPHTCPLSLSLILLFSFSPSFKNIPVSSLSLSLPLIPKHSLALFATRKQRKEVYRERTREMGHCAVTHLCPQRSLDGSDDFCLLFFFFYMIWLILKLCFCVCILIIWLCLSLEMFERKIVVFVAVVFVVVRGERMIFFFNFNWDVWIF